MLHLVLLTLFNFTMIDFIHPVTKKSVKDMLSNVNSDDCIRVFPLADGGVLDLEKRTLIMGILNVTPDSFSDGGKWDNLDAAVSHAKQMIAEGADIIDIGGESTRPGAASVTEEQEANRVIPVIQALRQSGIQIPISIDTYHQSVAEAAINAGASIVNDVSAGEDDPKMLDYVAKNGIPIILMHKRGNAVTMDKQAVYSDVVKEVAEYCNERTKLVMDLGLPRWNVMVDPGLGFAKNTQQNCKLVQEIPRFNEITGNMPLLV
jgi:dihydropteroate synthase